MTGIVTLRAFVSVVVVLGLLTLLVWALRRGSLSLSALRPRGGISVETATSLGDRRSLAIVNVEGKRLLVGLTPGAISLLADLAPQATPAASGASTGSSA